MGNSGSGTPPSEFPKNRVGGSRRSKTPLTRVDVHPVPVAAQPEIEAADGLRIRGRSTHVRLGQHLSVAAQNHQEAPRRDDGVTHGACAHHKLVPLVLVREHLVGTNDYASLIMLRKYVEIRGNTRKITRNLHDN